MIDKKLLRVHVKACNSLKKQLLCIGKRRGVKAIGCQKDLQMYVNFIEDLLGEVEDMMRSDIDNVKQGKILSYLREVDQQFECMNTFLETL